MSTIVRIIKDKGTMQTLITAREEIITLTVLTTTIILTIITTVITEIGAITIIRISAKETTMAEWTIKITTTIKIRTSETITIARRTAANSALDVGDHTMDLKEDQDRHIIQLGARYAITVD